MSLGEGGGEVLKPLEESAETREKAIVKEEGGSCLGSELRDKRFQKSSSLRVTCFLVFA